jgi:hypothetical protein
MGNFKVLAPHLQVDLYCGRHIIFEPKASRIQIRTDNEYWWKAMVTHIQISNWGNLELECSHCLSAMLSGECHIKPCIAGNSLGAIT